MHGKLKQLWVQIALGAICFVSSCFGGKLLWVKFALCPVALAAHRNCFFSSCFRYISMGNIKSNTIWKMCSKQKQIAPKLLWVQLLWVQISTYRAPEAILRWIQSNWNQSKLLLLRVHFSYAFYVTHGKLLWVHRKQHPLGASIEVVLVTSMCPVASWFLDLYIEFLLMLFMESCLGCTHKLL